MKKSVIFGTVLLLLVGVGLSVFIINETEAKDRPLKLPTLMHSNDKQTDAPPRQQERIIPEQTTTGGSGGGESATGGGTSSGSTSTTTCNGLQIPYALGSFSNKETCTQYEGSTCIEKIVNCSARVDNFDPTTGGEFELQFNVFYYNGTAQIQLGSYYEIEYVGASESQIISTIHTYTQSTAKETIECTTFTSRVPRICN